MAHTAHSVPLFVFFLNNSNDCIRHTDRYIYISLYIQWHPRNIHSGLLTAVSKQRCAQADSVFEIANYFNQANIKTAFPKFCKHVYCPTRGNSTLNHVIRNIKHVHRATPLPQLEQSDHISLFLAPAYRPLVNKVKPAVKEIQVWPEGVSEQLQDCFRHTDWTLF